MSAMNSEPIQTATTGFISPNTLYYLGLYAVVIVVRYFKLKKLADPKVEWDWKPVFHVALEIVYTSSGLLILLLLGLNAYTAFIIIIYALLLIISSQIEFMEEKFSKNEVFYTHVGIIAIIAVMTIVYFEFVAKEIEQQHISATNAQAERLNTPRVLIPYNNHTLRRSLAQN